MAPKKKGGKAKEKKSAGSSRAPAAGPEPEPGDTGELAGLRSRADLNGRRVEVEARAVGKDGAPRFVVRVLGNDEKVKVKAANLKVSTDTEGLAALAEAFKALDPDRRDWAGGLPKPVLKRIAELYMHNTYKAHFTNNRKSMPQFLKKSDREILFKVEEWKARPDRNCLFPFAMVCKKWRKAQVEVKGPLHSCVQSDIINPGRAELAKWALAEGCPRISTYPAPPPEMGFGDNLGRTGMAHVAAGLGHVELTKYLILEGGLKMDATMLAAATAMALQRGDRDYELTHWLLDQGCPAPPGFPMP